MKIHGDSVLGDTGDINSIDVDRFVFISTDKAVRSVTVTHPDVTRFLMTIPEACQLILQGGKQVPRLTGNTKINTIRKSKTVRF